MAAAGTLSPVVSGGASNTINGYIGAGRKKSEVVIYYRRPPGGSCSRYVVWGDSQWPKREAMETMGFEAMVKYGPIARRTTIGGEDSTYAWAPILNHPDGPAEFPVEQILENHWDDPDFYPPGAPDDLYFPQLEGVEIPHLPCPECDGIPPFNKPILLARHMLNNHDWPIERVFALGEYMGYDFKIAFARAKATTTVYSRPKREAPPSRPAYAVKELHVPSAAELAAWEGGLDEDADTEAPRILAADRAPKPKRAARRSTRGRKLSPEAAEKARAALAKANLMRSEKRHEQAADPLADAIAQMADA